MQEEYELLKKCRTCLKQLDKYEKWSDNDDDIVDVQVTLTVAEGPDEGQTETLVLPRGIGGYLVELRHDLEVYESELREMFVPET